MDTILGLRGSCGEIWVTLTLFSRSKDNKNVHFRTKKPKKAGKIQKQQVKCIKRHFLYIFNIIVCL